MRWKEKNEIFNENKKYCGFGSTEMQAHNNELSYK